MNEVYLLIGGNMGDRRASLLSCLRYIEQFTGKIIKTSAVYETEPWGFTEQPAFLNQALLINTELFAEDLLQKLLAVEEKVGRKRSEKYGPRVIDIDILFFNNEIIHTTRLRVPHPEIQHRRFVLIPMNEIAGSLVHPLLGKTINTLLIECEDNLEVHMV